jgi:hypothetical protein
MKYLYKLAAVASAAFFVASAHAQNVGTVSNHAVAVGKGAGKQGLTSVAPGASLSPLVSTGASTDPAFQTLTVAGGGTGLTTLAIGDLLQASSTSALARLAAVATGNVLISGGVGVVSSWGKVGLTTHVSGILPLANGGTNSDLSATGGTSQFLRQNTAGGAIAPIRPVCADLSNATSYCSAAVGQLPGETSNGSATAGNVGQYIESPIAVSTVSLVSGTAKDVTSISLTAGDWDVDVTAYFTLTGTTNMTLLQASISGTTNTIDSTVGKWTQITYPGTVPGAGQTTLNIPPYRLSLSGTTTVFFCVQGNFTVSTMSAGGLIRARRVR